MAMVSPRRDAVSKGRSRTRMLLGMGVTVLVAIGLLAVAALTWSGVKLASDPTALARVSVPPLGGTIEHVEAFGPHGRRVPLAVHGGRLTPLRPLTPGEQASGAENGRRPAWLGWALGKVRVS